MNINNHIPKTKSFDFHIEGMTCSSCVNHIEKKLSSTPGITNAYINLTTEKAKISVDLDQFEPRETQKNDARIHSLLVQLIHEAGYTAFALSAATENEKTINESKKPSLKKIFTSNSETIALIFCSALTLPLILPMFVELVTNHHLMLKPLQQLLLTIPVQFIFGAKFYRQTLKNILNRHLTMDALVASGTTAAFGLSIWNMLKNPLDPHLYFESAATIITFVRIGKWLESRAKRQTTTALSALEKLKPTKARIKRDQQEIELQISEIQINDQIIVRPGERIPVDGIILSGKAQIDESMLTGESLPLEKTINSKVLAGSFNYDGYLLIQAHSIERETILAKIIRLIEDAQEKKAPIQKLVDQVSGYFIPIVFFLSFITFIFWLIQTNNFEVALIHSIAVLVIACPCALGLATPTALMVGIGIAAKKGILIRDALTLEIAHKVNIVCFDKTGTITEGKPSFLGITDIQKNEFTSDIQKNELITIAASIQSASEHPLGKSIVEYATKINLQLHEINDAQTIAGKGIQGRVNGETYFLGSRKMFLSMHNRPTLLPALRKKAPENEAEFWIAKSDPLNTTFELLARFAFRDELKPTAKKTIQQLEDLRIKCILLTGDLGSSASSIANECGIKTVHSELTPEDKTNFIKNLQQNGNTVAMIGDGLNDAPALTQADLGIAMASGTDISIHAAGITIMKNDPLLVPVALKISSATYRKIKQNLFWAFLYNSIGIPLASMGFLSPSIAGIAMALSSVSVTTNALLLYLHNNEDQSLRN